MYWSVSYKFFFLYKFIFSLFLLLKNIVLFFVIKDIIKEDEDSEAEEKESKEEAEEMESGKEAEEESEEDIPVKFKKGQYAILIRGEQAGKTLLIEDDGPNKYPNAYRPTELTVMVSFLEKPDKIRYARVANLKLVDEERKF